MASAGLRIVALTLLGTLRREILLAYQCARIAIKLHIGLCRTGCRCRRIGYCLRVISHARAARAHLGRSCCFRRLGRGSSARMSRGMRCCVGRRIRSRVGRCVSSRVGRSDGVGYPRCHGWHWTRSVTGGVRPRWCVSRGSGCDRTSLRIRCGCWCINTGGSTGTGHHLQRNPRSTRTSRTDRDIYGCCAGCAGNIHPGRSRLRTTTGTVPNDIEVRGPILIYRTHRHIFTFATTVHLAAATCAVLAAARRWPVTLLAGIFVDSSVATLRDIWGSG